MKKRGIDAGMQKRSEAFQAEMETRGYDARPRVQGYKTEELDKYIEGHVVRKPYTVHATAKGIGVKDALGVINFTPHEIERGDTHPTVQDHTDAHHDDRSPRKNKSGKTEDLRARQPGDKGYDKNYHKHFARDTQKLKQGEYNIGVPDSSKEIALLDYFYGSNTEQRGISNLLLSDIVTFDVDDDTRTRYANRWKNIQNPDVLMCENNDGYHMQEVIDNFLKTVFDFYAEHIDEMHQYGLIDQSIQVEDLARQVLAQIVTHGDMYSKSLNVVLYPTDKQVTFVQVIDPVRSYLQDAFGKINEYFQYTLLHKFKPKSDDEFRLFLNLQHFLNNLSNIANTLSTFSRTEPLKKVA